MSIIMAVGNKKVEWAPKEQTEKKVIKTASEGGEVIEEEREETNPLYEAAKSFIEEKAKKEAQIEEVVDAPCDDAPCDDAPCDEVVEDIVGEGETKSVSEAVKEVEEKANAAAELTEKVEEAVQKIEEAVGEVKEAVGEEIGEVVEEISEGPEEIELEIDVDDNDNGGDLVVESEPDAEACTETKTDEEIEKSASNEEEFCKYAKLSPANKKKLANYWVNSLGYPRDYVALLTKDYEK